MAQMVELLPDDFGIMSTPGCNEAQQSRPEQHTAVSLSSFQCLADSWVNLSNFAENIFRKRDVSKVARTSSSRIR